mgnify:CR=1 FL=1
MYICLEKPKPAIPRSLRLHSLEVVALLDFGAALFAHGTAQGLARVDGGDGLLQRARLGARKVDALLLQRDLGRQRLQVARRQQLGLLSPQPLEREAALFLGLGYTTWSAFPVPWFPW